MGGEGWENDEDEYLIVRLADGPALVLVLLELSGRRRTLVEQAALRPDLAQTRIAGLRAAALGLSPGQAVMMQFARRAEPDLSRWGPCEMITPVVDHEMLPDTDTGGVGLLLGRDLLQDLWVTFLGARMVVIQAAPKAAH